MTIEMVSLVLKQMKKFEKIIKSNPLSSKWYDSHDIKIYLIMNRPCIRVDKLDSKKTKDSITKYLKTKKLIYWDEYDCYTITTDYYILLAQKIIIKNINNQK